MPRIEPCPPSSQKCVSSLNDDGYPATDPIAFSCSPDAAWTAVREAVTGQPRTTVEEEDGRYIAAICRTRLMRFKDRVEVEVDEQEGVIHLKSSSTLSWAGDDLNANRDRLETIGDAIRRALPAE